LVRRAGVRPTNEISAHVAHLSADALDVRIELAVLRLVLLHGHAGAVGLVLQREPAQVRDAPVADEVEQHVREPLNRSARDAQRPALPRDVDRGSGALREEHRAHERLHLVGIAEGLWREEDPRELRVKGAHLLLHVDDVRVVDADSSAESRVDVVIELPAVPSEARDNDG
jgi:hypothetical protein